MYNWFDLFLKTFTFATVGFLAATYLSPASEIRGSILLGAAAGFIGALPVSIIYRPICVVIARDDRDRDGNAIELVLASLGFHPSKAVGTFTSFARPGIFGFFGPHVLVDHSASKLRIFGPYLEVRRLQLAMRKLKSKIGDIDLS